MTGKAHTSVDAIGTDSPMPQDYQLLDYQLLDNYYDEDEEQKSNQSDLELPHHSFELEIHSIQLKLTPHLFQLITLPPA